MRWSWLDALAHDVRFALRSMARTPGFTAVAVLMIALGTGANAAMFSVIDAVMLHNPFADPERLALIYVQLPAGRTTAALSIEQYRSLTQSAPAFAAIGALGGGTRPTIAGLGEPHKLNVECVTAGTFHVLGTPPLLGRTFSADEDRPGGPAAVVLSYPFWQREFGGSADAIGRTMILNDVPTTIVGVMPRRFLGPLSRNTNDGWMPLGPTLGGRATAGCAARSSVNAFAKVQPGLTLAGAAALAHDTAGIGRLPAPDGRTGSQLVLEPLTEHVVSDYRTPLFALLGAVGLVLLIACANVANLQLERVCGRRQELAVRVALGATRGRVVRQALIENLLLWVTGAAAGVLFAGWTLQFLVGLMPGYVPHLYEIAINVRVLAATFAVACATGLAVGLVPALQAVSPALVNDLRTSSRSSTTGGAWARRVLVVAQIALSLTLLVGATLMVRTFMTLRPADPGFTFRDKFTGMIRLPGTVAAGAAQQAFFNDVFDRIRAIPGVAGVSGSTYLPMSGNIGIAAVDVGGQKADVWSGVVTATYFAEMAIPITRGRAFDDRDRSGASPVAIVNEAMVRKFWPAGDPVGAMLQVKSIDGRTEARQVVGVLRDARSDGGDTRARPELYTPYAQTPVAYLNVIVRTANPADPRLHSAVKTAVAAVDRTQVLDRVSTFDETIGARLSTWRFGAWLLGIFAGMAVVLAAVGLAASIGWWVAQRTREIGVRMALGAHPAQVTRLFLRQGLGLTVIGVAAGLAGAAATTRLLASWLYGVTPLDPGAFALASGAMLAIAVLASYLPARRAARVDPLIALRAD
jgi:predicted permease